MRYAHLLWAIANWGPHYRLAQAISKSEARLSRCLSGRTEFTAEERAALARVLGFSEGWLFEDVVLPGHDGSAGLALELGTADD